MIILLMEKLACMRALLQSDNYVTDKYYNSIMEHDQ